MKAAQTRTQRAATILIFLAIVLLLSIGLMISVQGQVALASGL